MRKRSVSEIRRLVSDMNPAHPGNPEPVAGGRLLAHQVHEYLHLAAALGANPEPLPPCLKVTPEEIDGVVEKFNLTTAAANNRLFLGLNPGAEYGPAKRWPAERFAAARWKSGSAQTASG